MIDAHFVEKMTAEFEAAFEAKYTPLRTTPKTYAPVAPKTPWYLKPFEDGGENSKN